MPDPRPLRVLHCPTATAAHGAAAEYVGMLPVQRECLLAQLERALRAHKIVNDRKATRAEASRRRAQRDRADHRRDQLSQL